MMHISASTAPIRVKQKPLYSQLNAECDTHYYNSLFKHLKNPPESLKPSMKVQVLMLAQQITLRTKSLSATYTQQIARLLIRATCKLIAASYINPPCNYSLSGSIVLDGPSALRSPEAI